jgi:hypothetical protein
VEYIGTYKIAQKTLYLQGRGMNALFYKPTGRNYNCPACKLKMHRDVVGAVNIRTKHLTGVLSGDGNFNSPKVKYLRIDDLRSSKSSSVAGVNRRERRKPRLHRCRLGVPMQLTLFPWPKGEGKAKQAVWRKA